MKRLMTIKKLSEVKYYDYLVQKEQVKENPTESKDIVFAYDLDLADLEQRLFFRNILIYVSYEQGIKEIICSSEVEKVIQGKIEDEIKITVK